MNDSLFSPRVRRFGEGLTLLIFFGVGVWFLWRAWQFQAGPDDLRPWVSTGLAALCFLQFGVALWAQRRRRRLERRPR